MSLRAIIMPMHKYTPFGDEFYAPILDYQLNNLQKYKAEYGKLYLIDSNWGITPSTYVLPPNVIIIKVPENLRYYDAYKEVLPQIKENLVLFMDNDMVVYKKGKIMKTFAILEDGVHDVVSIYDTIGTMKVDLPNGKNKFCPYWFSAKKETLLKYLGVDWSSDNMPYTETFGLLTEAMLKDGLKPYEWEEDKTEVKSWDPLETGKTLGYYHCRNGSLAAYLLATKHYGDINTYNEYLKNQPKQETIRLCCWYDYMGGDSSEIRGDLFYA